VVDLTNKAPASGLPDYVIGSFAQPAPPKGTNRTSVFVYTAVPIRDAQLDGKKVQVTSGRTAGGWYVHQLVASIPPGRTVSLRMHLAGPLPAGPYSLQIEPGGGPVPDDVTVEVTVDGRRIRSRRSAVEAALVVTH
jgi:hypothetical protein